MWFPDIGKRPWRNIDMMITGVCGVIDGLALVLSLGEVQIHIEMRYLVWRTERHIESRQEGRR